MNPNYTKYARPPMQQKNLPKPKKDFFGNNTMTLMLAAGMLSVTVVIINLFFV